MALLAHNWEGEVAHIVRSNGETVRVLVGSLQVTPFVGLQVKFYRGGKGRRKTVTPSLLCMMEILWANNDVSSCVEEEEVKGDTDSNLEVAPLTVPPITGLLPKWEVKGAELLGSEEKVRLEVAVAETHLLQKIM